MDSSTCLLKKRVASTLPFIISNGQYEFLRPCGMCNSLSMFQRYVNEIFKELNGNVVLTYMDLIISVNNKEQALERLKIVLETASMYGLKFNWKKSQFLKNSIEYLGHVIENGMIKPSSKKLVQ